MYVNQGSILRPGLVILAAALAHWCAPAARADEMIPRQPAVGRAVGMPVALGGMGGSEVGQGFQVRSDARPSRLGLRTAADWENYLRQQVDAEDENTTELLKQALVLALEMVVISYNGQTSTTTATTTTTSTTTTTVVAAQYQPWQWQAGSWSLPPPPQLPPGKLYPPVSNVPEPASLVSGLIGAGLAGWGIWRRRRRQSA